MILKLSKNQSFADENLASSALIVENDIEEAEISKKMRELFELRNKIV